MAVHSQSGRLARFAGSNDGLQVEYLTPATYRGHPKERAREHA